jgi:hypothetical protein
MRLRRTEARVSTVVARIGFPAEKAIPSRHSAEHHSPGSPRRAHRTAPSSLPHLSQASVIQIPRSRRRFSLCSRVRFMRTHLRGPARLGNSGIEANGRAVEGPSDGALGVFFPLAFSPVSRTHLPSNPFRSRCNFYLECEGECCTWMVPRAEVAPNVLFRFGWN